MKIKMPLLLLLDTKVTMIRELKQPRRRRQQKPHKFAYLTMKNRIFARFARAVFIFWHFEEVLVLSTTWNDLFCSCVDDVSIWWQMFTFVVLPPKRWFQLNSRIVRTHFSNIMTLNYWKIIAERRSDIFRWHSRFRRRRGCLSSVLFEIGRLKFTCTLVSVIHPDMLIRSNFWLGVCENLHTDSHQKMRISTRKNDKKKKKKTLKCVGHNWKWTFKAKFIEVRRTLITTATTHICDLLPFVSMSWKFHYV